MDGRNDDLMKLIAVKIVFADSSAKNDFKRLTNTDPIHNRVLDFESIFPIPSNLSTAERCAWRNQVWGSDAMDCEGETMKEGRVSITYEFTTKVGIPIEFVKNLYLFSRIKKAQIRCLDSGDYIYANDSGTAPCKKRGCDHAWCAMAFQHWEAKYNWSKLPHPLFDVAGMLGWIRNSFGKVDEREVGLIYHQILCEVVKLRKLANSDLVAAAKEEFERQVGLCGNAYIQTMVALNDYDRSPGYVFKNGQSLIYKDAIDYYLKKTQPVRQLPRFPSNK